MVGFLMILWGNGNMEIEKKDEHDPFCGIDFDEQLKLADARVKQTTEKMLENFKNQMVHYLQANNQTGICLHMDVNVDGRWKFNASMVPDIKKKLDAIEAGQPQDLM